MSRPSIAAPANSIIPPGQTVRVVRVKLTFTPLPGERCRFDVTEVLRKG